MPFIPLDQAEAQPQARRGFIPLDEVSSDADQPSVLRNVLLNNPGTAIAETAANLGSQMLALPAAGLAGIGAAAGRALGFAEADPADVVHAVGDAMTYQPRGEMGKATSDAVMYPFQKLAEVGAAAGDKTLDVTGSPVAATIVDTAINSLPMLIAPAAKGAKAVRERFRETPTGDTAQAATPGRGAAETVESIASPSGAADRQAAARGFIPIEEADNGVQAGTERMAGDAQAMPERNRMGLEALRGQGRDGASALDQQLQPIPGGHGAGADAATLAGKAGRDGQLHASELPLDDLPRAGAEALELPEGGIERAATDNSRDGTGVEYARRDPVAPSPGIRPEPGRSIEPGAIGAEESGGNRVPGRIADDSAVSQADRGRSAATLGEDQGGLADRARADARAAAVREAADLESRLFAGGDLGPWEMRKATVGGALQREVIQHARDRYDGIRADLGLPPVDQWTVRPDDLPRVSIRPVSDLATPAADATGAVQDMAGSVQNSWAPGANYVGFIDDTRSPAAEARAKPITREEVLTPLMKALDVPIYEGRIAGKRKLGHYRTFLEEVRIKRKSDLEVAAHEIAHLLDDRIPEIRKTWSEGKGWQAIRGELKGVSYDAKNVKEGFAEFVRLWTTQPEEAARRAPTFDAWFNEFVGRHQYGPALLKAREGMTAWFDQSALDRARSKIGTRDPLNEALGSIAGKWRQSVVDDLHGVYRMERDLKDGKTPAMGAYETARLTRASQSIADGAVRYGYPVKKADGSFEFRGKGLQEILKPAADRLDDALLYFTGRAAQELMMQGREHLFTKGEIRDMVALETPEFRKAFAEYQTWNKGVVDFAEAHGVVNGESRRAWQRQSYLPFWRVEQPGDFKGGKPGNWSGIKALTGGTDNLRDILGNMTGNAAMLIEKALKNGARQQIADLASSERGGGRFMVKIPPESRPVKIDAEQIVNGILKTMGLDPANPDPAAQKLIAKVRKMIGEGSLDLMQTGQPPAGNNVVAVLRAGRPEWYEVADPLLYRALSSIDRPNQHWLVKWLGLPKRIGQVTVTLTPDFMVRNIARDTIMGGVMSRGGFKPIFDSLDGMRLRLKNDPLYREFIANGGGLSSIYMDADKFRADLDRFYGRNGIDIHTVLDTPKKLLNAVETLADAFESSTRLGEFKRAKERGENPRHAAYLGREVSTDFAMRGDSKTISFLYDVCMFLRPAVISIDRLGRGLAHDPNRGAIATKAGMIALSSMALYLLNRDDPRYTDLPDFDRDSYWHIFVGDQHFRMVKTWEIGALGSIAERSTEKLLSEDPLGLGKDFARILGATFGLNLTPQIIAPLAEQAANRNSFTNAPIETPGMENVQPFLRAKPSTSETMRAAGMATAKLPEDLQVNPVRAEALLRGYFNTFATYGLMLSDRAFFNDKLPATRADELPVVRSFYEQEPRQHTRFESQFYDMLSEAKRLHGTLHELDKQGRPDLADDKEKGPLAPEYKPLEKASINVRAINHEMLATRLDANLSPEDKRAKLDALTAEKNALLKATVLDSQAAQKGTTAAEIARQGTLLK